MYAERAKRRTGKCPNICKHMFWNLPVRRFALFSYICPEFLGACIKMGILAPKCVVDNFDIIEYQHMQNIAPDAETTHGKLYEAFNKML